MSEASAFSSTSAPAFEPLTARTDKLLHQVATTASQNKEIDKSSRDFESILLASWLQQAQHSFAAVPGEDDDADAGKDQYLSIAMESLGNSMSASGGIGIAKMIAAQLHKTESKHADHVSGQAAATK